MDAAELQLHKDITEAFIMADVEEINFRKYTREEDGAGGFRMVGPVDIATQLGRMIPKTDSVPEIETSFGRMAIPEWTLLMAAGADIARYYRFTWRGLEWEVAQVHTKPDYERKGDVVRYGG